jgi:hypothetical protein
LYRSPLTGFAPNCCTIYCSHCNTPFTIVSIEEGKSKFCENCGEVIYKNENGVIVTFQPEEVLVKQDNEQELSERINREKETRFKEQLERKEKEKEFRERLDSTYQTICIDYQYSIVTNILW